MIGQDFGNGMTQAWLMLRVVPIARPGTSSLEEPAFPWTAPGLQCAAKPAGLVSPAAGTFNHTISSRLLLGIGRE